jgi:hypothetical protein
LANCVKYQRSRNPQFCPLPVIVPKYNSERRFSRETWHSAPAFPWRSSARSQTLLIRCRGFRAVGGEQKALWFLFHPRSTPCSREIALPVSPCYRFNRINEKCPVLGGFSYFLQSSRCFSRKSPCFGPNNRETGSYLTAHTTIQSPQTGRFRYDAE